MSIIVDFQLAAEQLDEGLIPDSDQVDTWVSQVIAFEDLHSAQVTVRVTNENEMTALNETYRRKQGVTNVLAFPFEQPELMDPPFLGDIVICAPVVNEEAREQNKSAASHWAHMVVHGLFHLLGYDHQNEKDALIMEARETEMMGRLGYPDPY
ncbi:MAG: rRNA maturation RNase YbeY [Gammaproteobacteria bacterium]